MTASYGLSFAVSAPNVVLSTSSTTPVTFRRLSRGFLPPWLTISNRGLQLPMAGIRNELPAVYHSYICPSHFPQCCGHFFFIIIDHLSLWRHLGRQRLSPPFLFRTFAFGAIDSVSPVVAFLVFKDAVLPLGQYQFFMRLLIKTASLKRQLIAYFTSYS